jgi:DNA-directed RNA polymerase specialized sigma24 family protein
MVPTNNITVFLRHNDSELRYMVIHVCESLSYPGSVEDLVQDIYLKFLSSNILQNYNRHFIRGRSVASQMSTYLYPIIRNFILSRLKSQDYRYKRSRIHNYDPVDDELTDLDRMLSNHPISNEFKATLHHNETTDQTDGVAFELRDFERRFRDSKHNRKYDLKKRKDKSKKTPDCTLFDIFKYLYEGYSNKEIARIYHVSDMTITHLKHQLGVAMMKYGFGEGIIRDSIKMPEMPVEA